MVDAGPHLSVSHSGLVVAVAVCEEARVGVDVQRVADLTEPQGAAAWVEAEAQLKAGADAPTGADAGAGVTVVRLTPPVPGYAAALAVDAGGRPVTTHERTWPDAESRATAIP